MELQCLNCSVPLVWSGRGRPPTKFCSAKCKEAERTARQARVRLEERIERACLSCGMVLPAEKFGKARCCSKACSVKYQNDRRAEKKAAAKLAVVRSCLKCGVDITTTRLGAQYCSRACQQAAAHERRRADGRVRAYNRLRLYGITREQFEAMIEAQGHRCAICGDLEPAGRGTWHVDHCHDSQRIRGLLCHHCNLLLGNAKDDPKRLRAAARYVEASAS